MTFNVSWSPEQTEALRSHVGAGLSYSRSAAAINEKFGTEFSRNAAIGRANRIGLACPARVALSPEERKPRIYKQRIRIVSANKNSNAQRVIEVTEAEQYKCRAVEIVPRNLTLLELEPDDCRYPYGDDAVTFCGHPKMEGSSYCCPHFHLTHGIGTPSERRAARGIWEPMVTV